MRTRIGVLIAFIATLSLGSRPAAASRPRRSPVVLAGQTGTTFRLRLEVVR
jgi:hypothetical protein